MSAVVCPRVLLSVRALVLLSQYVIKRWTEFHQILVDDVVEGTDELIRF